MSQKWVCICGAGYKPTIQDRFRKFFKMKPVDYRAEILGVALSAWMGYCTQCCQPYTLEKLVRSAEQGMKFRS